MTKWAHVERDVREAEHKKTVAQYKREIAHYRDALDESEEALNAALALSSSDPDPKPLTVEVEDKSEAVAVALASDWHVEERIDKRSVNNMNEFNLKIAEQRIRNFFKGVVRWTEIQRTGVKVEDLVLWLGGDFISGHIHPELAESNSMTPVEAIVWVQDLIAEGIETLTHHFRRILIPTSYGNHGRDTIKTRHSTGYKHSYEWLMYKNLQRLTGDTQVLWQVGESYHNIMKLYDYTLRFHHGDSLKYQGGIGGLTIPVEKAIASWNKSPVKADIDCFGHWHTQIQSPKFCSNGSLCGYGAYALSIKAPYEPPQQTFFLIDKKRGRTVTCPIIL